MRLVGVSNVGRQTASMTGKLRLHKVRPVHYMQFVTTSVKYTFLQLWFYYPILGKFEILLNCHNLSCTKERVVIWFCGMVFGVGQPVKWHHLNLSWMVSQNTCTGCKYRFFRVWLICICAFRRTGTMRLPIASNSKSSRRRRRRDKDDVDDDNFVTTRRTWHGIHAIKLRAGEWLIAQGRCFCEWDWPVAQWDSEGAGSWQYSGRAGPRPGSQLSAVFDQ